MMNSFFTSRYTTRRLKDAAEWEESCVDDVLLQLTKMNPTRVEYPLKRVVHLREQMKYSREKNNSRVTQIVQR